MNPLWQQINPLNSAQININSMQSIISLMRSKNPSEVTTMLLNSNPQFKEFYETNKNKNPEEIAKEYGIDFSLIRQLLNNK